MIVIAVNQVHGAGVDEPDPIEVAGLTGLFGDRVPLTGVGAVVAEFQLAVDTGDTALAVALILTRGGLRRVGIGVGTAVESFEENMPSRAGNALAAAHAAVTRADKKATHLALVAHPGHPLARDAEALVDLLVVLRARRSAPGWEIYDLLVGGLTQAEAAERMGITPQSASKRARAAEIRSELAALGPLGRLIDRLDDSVSRAGLQRPASATDTDTRSGGRGG